MADSLPDADREREDREIQAAESRVAFALAGGFTVLLAGTLVYVYSLFEPLAPAGKLHAWAAFMGSVTLIMAVVPLVVYVRAPDVDEIVRVWDRVGKGVAVLYDLAVASSVWLLLPYASEALQLLMVIFYSAALSGQVISTAESTDTIVFGVVAIFGSAALFFLQSESVYAGSLAVFLLAFGAMLVAVSLVLKQAIRSAIRQRLHAERISADLETALAETREARDARTRFIAAASHDLRQPLQAAMLFFQQLVREPDAQRRQRAEAGVRQGFAEANALLERMLEHLRLESGTVQVRLEPVPLAPLFAALVQEHAPAARAAGIDLRGAQPDCAVLADRSLLSRILRNLLHNALLHAGAARVRLLARQRGTQVEIFVIDDGVGIEAGRIERLFTAYTQGPAARSAGRGMGLGLAIARESARLMAGELDLQPRWRKGAAFRLSLPAAEWRAEGPDPSAHAALPAPARLQGLSLLVIDDDEAAGAALAGALAQYGAEVRRVTDREGMIAAVATAVPDLILTDWQLGAGITGAAVLAALASHGHRDLPVIVMTGDGSRETLVELDRLGLPVLWKPVDIDRLLEMIRDLTGVSGPVSGQVSPRPPA